MSQIYLRPNGVGDYSQLSPVGDSPGWKCVDEVTADEGVTRIQSNAVVLGSYGEDLYTVTSPSAIPDGATINWVYMLARMLKTFDGPIGQYEIKENSLITRVTPTLTTSWANYSTTWSTRPSGGAWTKADLSSIQIGCRGNRNITGVHIRITQLFLLVDYTELTRKKSIFMLNPGLGFSN